MASQQQLHFVLVPQLAQGHIIPMVDMARLLAERGVIVTIVTTALNTFRFRKTVNRAVDSGLPIRLLQLRFPCAEAGLPEGCENVDSVPSQELIYMFFNATARLQEPLEQSFGELQPSPSCMISDMAFPWTAEIAMKFQIPRIEFNGRGCFPHLTSHNLLQYKFHESITSESEPFVIPGLPDRIEIPKAMLPEDMYQTSDELKDLCDQIKAAEQTAYGVVINSFQELEPEYVERYMKAKSNKVWCIGPVSLCNKDTLDKVERGQKASTDQNQCLKWLDSKDPRSVVYACFGSLCPLTSSEMMEVGLGLEASGCPFVWVIRGGERYPELEKWLSEVKFEERNKDRGLLIMGWAPQVLILSHRAIDGFLTHCGWNSVLEGVCAGVPMITWPMFSEQFLNEKLVVQVLRIGDGIGVNDVPGTRLEKIGRVEMKEQMEKAVNRVMDGGEEGEERRKRVRELGDKAKKAMEEGGSSHLNMTLLIENIIQLQASKELPIQSVGED